MRLLKRLVSYASCGVLAASMLLQPVALYAETVTAESDLVSESQEQAGSQEESTSQSDQAIQEGQDGDQSVQPSSEEGESPVPTEDPESETYPILSYTAHVSNIGWQSSSVTFDASKDDATDPAYSPLAGTTGRSLSIEALRGSVSWENHTASLLMRSHVQNIGWQSWNSGSTGTTGKGLHMEAVELKLGDEAAQQYDIYYRVHVSNIGWMGWAKNGEPAGTTGQSKAIEAIQIRLVKKNDGNAPTSSLAAFRGASETLKGAYRTLNGSATSTAAKTDVVIGSENGAALQSFSLAVNNQINSGSVQYRAYRQFEGWSGSWSSNGQPIDSANTGHAVQAVQFQLTDSVASVYDIWYRVHDVSKGWLGWASNGVSAGLIGQNAAVNAIQIRLVPKGSAAPGSTDNAFTETTYQTENLVYQAHVASRGWLSAVSDGETAGTSGAGLSLQALNVQLVGPVAGSVNVQAHVSNKGWMNTVSAPQLAGTVGQSLPIEAIKLSLSGDAAQQYDIYYRLHVANYGWLGWAKNGDVAGTTGLSRQAEAIQIKLVKKDDASAAPSGNGPAYIAPTLSAKAHVQDIGWTSAVSNAQILGTTGQGKRIEAFSLTTPNNTVSGGITYSAHVQNIGWQGWVSDGAIAGTTGKSLRVEAIKIKLTGEMSKYFDVWYRVHVQNLGWMGWTSNGAQAGTSSMGYRVEAIQVKIVAKGSGAPGSTYRPFTDCIPQQLPGDQMAMLNIANRYASNTNWLLLVNNSTCRVGVYQGSRGRWRQVNYWVCSPGKPSTPTVRGEYTVTGRGYSFGHGYTCYYWTQFYGDYLFHSIVYDQETFRVQDGRLGQQLSHGCVRLDINNAKWIYQNIPNGTKVVSF